MNAGQDQLQPVVAGNPAAAAENPGQNSQQTLQNAARAQQQYSIWSIVKSIMIRALIIYFITSFFRRPAQQTQSPEMPTRVSQNMFSNGTVMDMYVYVSDSEKFTKFDDNKSLVWKQLGLVYGDWLGGPNGDGLFYKDTEIETTAKMRNNGSIWLHVYIVRQGLTPDPRDRSNYFRQETIHKYKRLNRYKKLRYTKTHNLLTGETSASPETIKKAAETPMEILSHWHPNLTINVIDDHTSWVQGHVPPPLDEFVEFEPVSGKYYPIVYLNDYWSLSRDFKPINEDDVKLPLHLTFQPLSLFRWQLYSAQAMRSKWTSFLGSDLMQESDEDQDSMKEAFLETSPVLLGLTFVVSIVHSVFEFLAFKNDIQFWNNRKSLEGLSVRSVFFNVFQCVVVLLYVLDNETTVVVRISVFVALLIEIWKIHKVTDVKIDGENRYFGVIPRIKFQDKGSYVASSTKQYDIMAFRYLSWALFPLLGCYAVYSLLYLEHKGWYSWVLGMLYGYLLTFGFIMMCPQLFINYKLKSVAHLPWRMLTYKFLNTFIDDIFAFVMKMPTMYRIGCFRDDIVFCIYLYQRWIYAVDPKRVNEYGIAGEMEAEHADANGVVHEPEEKPEEEKKKD